MAEFRYGIAAAFVTGLALFAVSCTGGASDAAKGGSAQDSGGAGDGKKEDEAYAYRQCLRDNGLKVQEPKPGQAAGIEVKDEKALKKAQEACKDLPGAGNGKEMSPEEQQKALDKAVAYARCMREQGIDMPDPQMEDGKLSMRAGGGPDVSREKMDKATKACNDKLGK
ncbi:hypothetical protein ACFVFQ_04940 [Streptomyces sp. NPDC057743]|uniref:hypothetical protein n=1 Tax=Streptomyces sp. NPDC057743 TaxID=3346236 RepID=UPI0036B56C1E